MLKNQQPCRRRVTARAAVLIALLIPAGVPAQEAAPNGEQPPTPLVSIALDDSHLGYTNPGEGGSRYFVTQVRLTNESDRPLSVPIDDFELTADGKGHSPDMEFPRTLAGYNFRTNGRLHRFSELNRTEQLDLAPGKSAASWIVFPGLVKSQDVPQLDLRLTLEGVEHHLDVTACFDETLQLKLERIGPKGALGLLMIGGRLNTISVGTLVETIDQLASAGISRIVVGFGDEAQPLDEPLGRWLRQSADGVQTNRTFAMFPAVVSTIRQLHIARIPGQDGRASSTPYANPGGAPVSYRRSGASSAHLHESVASAVEAALASAYRGLTPDEIAAEIEQGHRLAQAAALVNGGADLPASYLPLLLERTESDDPLLRRGALIALSGTGHAEALQALTEQARSADRSVAALAVECLAASRFAGAHEALHELLEGRLAVERSRIVQTLARYPRPEWADYLSELAGDDQQTVPADVRNEVLLALGRIGHPKLPQILGETLQAPDEDLQQTAFGLLLSRQDEQSERLAMEFSLQQLSSAPPTPQMLQLFDRVRDPRITPLLLPYLDDAKQTRNRSGLINTLARIGPSDIDDELAARYERFNPQEQAAVLQCLTQLRSPRLPALAQAALASENAGVFNAAVRSLSMTGDLAAVEILGAQLEVEEQTGRVSTLAKALKDIGLPEADRALELVRNGSSGDKRTTIADRLRELRLLSPGGQYLQQAERQVREDEYQKAVEYYTLALKRDPDMAPAFSGRGHAHLKLEDYEQAEADFRQCIELDPDDGLAVAGLGITLAISGETDEAIRIIEEASDRFTKDLLFAYNAACVYGRVLEHIPEEPESEAQQQRRTELQAEALSRLKTSLQLGFTELDWMRDDPDLATLRHLKRFQKLVSGEEPVEGRRPIRRRNVPVPQEQ